MKTGKRLLVILAIVLMIFGALLITAKAFLTYQINKRLTPEMKEDLQKMTEVKYSFKSDKQQNAAEVSVMPQSNPGNEIQSGKEGSENSDHPLAVTNFTSDTLSLLNEYRNLHKETKVSEFLAKAQKERKSDPYNINISEEITAGLERSKPAIETFIKLVNSSDYEIEIWPSRQPIYSTEISSSEESLLMDGVTLLKLKAFEICGKGKYQESSELCGSMYRASKSSRYSSIITQLYNISIIKNTSGTLFQITQECNDVNILKSILNIEEMSGKYATAFTSDISPVVLDNIGILRFLKRRGVESDIEGKTGMEIAAESYNGMAKYIEKNVLPQEKDPGKIMTAKENINSYYIWSAALGGEAKNWKAFGIKIIAPFVRPALISPSLPNLKEIEIRKNTALAYYNLLKSETAGKIYALENNSRPENLSVLTDKYLKNIPADPFGENNNQLNYNGKSYSIGPDKADQKAELLYDPTNGTISPGDIYYE